MTTTIRRVAYVHVTVKDQPGAAAGLLSQLAAADVNLLAFTAVPVGPALTQLVLYPEQLEQMVSASRRIGLETSEPQQALLVQGDDRLGALADVHDRLAAARVNVYASYGVSDGRGGYGYVISVRPQEFERAAAALDV